MTISKKQLAELKALRAKGYSYPQLSQHLLSKHGIAKGDDTIRKALNGQGKVAKGKKEVKVKKLLDPKPNPIRRDSDKADNSVILCISDLHAPYHHPDAIAFLAAIKAKYKPTRVIVGGDEIDHHAMSFHDSDPDLLSAGAELEAAIEALRPIYKLFPVADVLESNHGSMAYRKGKHHGIARKYLRHYNEVLDAPDGWVWHDNLRITLDNGQMLYATHGVKSNGIQLAQTLGCNVLQFHFHTRYNITYGSSPSQLYWSLQAGCLIDDKSLAFAYNKTTEIRPIIGIAIIIDGLPRLLPMLLNTKGRWTKYVP